MERIWCVYNLSEPKESYLGKLQGWKIFFLCIQENYKDYGLREFLYLVVSFGLNKDSGSCAKAFNSLGR